jgi:hypothetical protein
MFLSGRLHKLNLNFHVCFLRIENSKTLQNMHSELKNH